MRTNSFTKNMQQKTDSELAHIIENKNAYTAEALQAVVWELEDRNLIEKGEIEILEVAIKQDEIQEKVPETRTINKEDSFKEFEQPILYSKKAIQGFTIFFSTIFGTILLMHNLKAINKHKERTQVLIFGILYTILSYILLEVLPKIYFITLIFNFIGYLILAEYFWNKYLGKDLQHEKKSIPKPLLISLSITAFFIFLIFLPLILGE